MCLGNQLLIPQIFTEHLLMSASCWEHKSSMAPIMRNVQDIFFARTFI